MDTIIIPFFTFTNKHTLSSLFPHFNSAPSSQEGEAKGIAEALTNFWQTNLSYAYICQITNRDAAKRIGVKNNCKTTTVSAVFTDAVRRYATSGIAKNSRKNTKNTSETTHIGFPPKSGVKYRANTYDTTKTTAPTAANLTLDNRPTELFFCSSIYYLFNKPKKAFSPKICTPNCSALAALLPGSAPTTT